MPDEPEKPRLRVPGIKPTKVRIPTKARVPRKRRTRRLPVREPEPVDLKAQIEAEIAQIRATFEQAQRSFHAVGKALNELNRPEVLRAFEVRRFDRFCDRHVLPYRTVERYMKVARHFTEDAAVEMRLMRAYHLARYVERSRTKWSAMQLKERNARLGKARKRLSEMNSSELKLLADTATEGDATPSEPSAEEARSVENFSGQVLEFLDLPGKVKVDRKRGRVTLEFALEEVLEHF